MLTIHATNALLRSSNTAPVFYVPEPSSQKLQSWYACLIESGFEGSYFILYIHQPSMLTVVCPGSTINDTIDSFRTALTLLLCRYGFDEFFIRKELNEMENYTVSKTFDKWMLGYIANISRMIKDVMRYFSSYKSQDTEFVENMMMDFRYRENKSANWQSPAIYWNRIDSDDDDNDGDVYAECEAV